VPSPEPPCRTSTTAGTIALVRILILDTCYPAFLDAHYSERTGLDAAAYDVQWRALMDRFFGTSDAYSHYLGELGHEAHELVVNCAPMQQAWAKEHGIASERMNAPKDSLVLAQAEDFRPDVVYVQDLNALSPSLLRALGGQSRLLVGQIASKTPSRARLEVFQLLITAAPHFVELFRRQGIETEFIRLGFDPRVLARLNYDGPRSGAAFVGAIGRSRTWRSNVLLERAAERVPIDFWGYKVGVLPLRDAVMRRYRGEAWGLTMYEVLARSKIALNRHGDVAGDHAINMRLYEATGVGTLLVTDAKGDLSDIFTAGEEVITYRSEDELAAKIEYYLDNEDERARISRAGQERTLREHTYANRMRELESALHRRLA
jgi:spore maturation protein CgeB